MVSISSGSCGNCAILSYGSKSIIIDAGVGIRRFQQTVKAKGLDISGVQAIFITHDHADHTRGAVRLAHRYQWPIYAGPGVAGALINHRYASAELGAYLKRMEVGATVRIGEMAVRSFEVPHDATQNVGYAVDTPAGRYTHITDIGEVTPTIIREIRAANYLVFESNYDTEMLRKGRYPFYLKERIAGGRGHISNDASAQVIAEHLQKSTRFLALCHLSGENNTPELALETHRKKMRVTYDHEANGLQLVVLKRNECSPVYHLTKER